MLVGLPSSGKSTYAKEMQDNLGYIVLSSDALRQEMFGDVNCQDKNNKLFNELHRRIKVHLQQGDNVCYDACNINYKKRMAFLQQIKSINCTKSCIIIARPYELCINFDNIRQKSVGKDVITRMYYNFTIPQYYEGWDNISIVQNYDITDIETQSMLWERLNAMPQDNPYHTKTIGKHCDSCHEIYTNIVTNGLNKPLSQKQYHQCIAAQWHDVGKWRVKTYNENKGYHTFYNHQNVGAYDTMIYLLPKFIIVDYVLYICNLIQWHMQPFFLTTQKSIDKFINLVGEEFYNDLLLLHKSDKLAK